MGGCGDCQQPLTVQGLPASRQAGLNFATAERGLHDESETGNPRHISEFIATGDEVIEFRLHVETDAGTIVVGGDVLRELWRLFRFFEAADSASRCSQALGGNSEPDKCIA